MRSLRLYIKSYYKENMKNLKCHSCGYVNESGIEIAGISICRICGSEIGIVNRRIIAEREEEKRRKFSKKN